MKYTDPWPPYTIGTRLRVFALVVTSVIFTELESIIQFMFATVFSLGLDDAIAITSRIGTEAAVTLMEQKLPTMDSADKIRAAMSHFLASVRICIHNRNHLMHSILAWTDEDTMILFKTTRQGHTHMAAPSPTELRRVADDMNSFIIYGRQLSNAINNTLGEIPIFPVAAYSWPELPPLPYRLEYSPDPRPIRKSDP
jgi:hypothetical protein